MYSTVLQPACQNKMEKLDFILEILNGQSQISSADSAAVKRT